MVFEVGETVVYPHHGAARIEEIKMRTIKGEEKMYLKLKVAQGDLTIEVPAENVDLVGVRDVVDAEGLEHVMEVLRAEHPQLGDGPRLLGVAARHLHAADRLDLRARDRLVISDDRQRLHGRTRQAARLLALAAQQVGEIGGCLHVPALAAPDDRDAAPGVILGEAGERAAQLATGSSPDQRDVVARSQESADRAAELSGGRS